MHEDRIARLRTLLNEAGLAGLLLSPSPLLRYVTGANLPRGDRLNLVYIGAQIGDIQAIVPAFEEANWNEEVALPSTVHGWEDTEGPEATVADVLGSIDACTVGVDPLAFSFRDYSMLAEAAPQLSLVSAASALDTLRLLKSETEAACVQAAARIAEAALDDTLEMVATGKTEAEIAALLSSRLFARGGETISFGPIVLSGAKSAMPHGVPDEAPIQDEALLLFDFGTAHLGYHCDITRTFYVGRAPSDELRALYDAVATGNARGREAAKPGATCHDVHWATQAHLHEPPFAADMKHRTGHGLGLDVHEAPSIMDGNHTALSAGMLFTIEPGVYRAGVGGVRIEDDVWITSTGCDSLTRYPREFRCISAC